MPRPKPTDDDLKQRKALAKELKAFRAKYKVTQRKLADMMEGVGCRRTLQMLEAGLITPHRATLTRLEIVKNKIAAGLVD